jgi:tetratricopeptide (TPR) repeat protein
LLSADDRRGATRADFAIAAALIVAVVALFGRSVQFGFVNLDDTDYVTANPWVLQGLTADSIRWAFTAFHSGHWHPLTWLSLMLDTTLFGPGPAARHAVNVGLHALNAALAWAVLVRATGSRGRSAVVAALFALHPLRVESVVWITERKDVLSGLFFLLTLLAWIGWVRRPSRLRYAAVAGAFALGLLAKPMLVTLPAVLLLLDIWPLDRWRRERAIRLVAEKLPLFALALASSLVTLASQGAAGATESTDVVPLLARLSGAAWGYLAYLGKTMWPIELAVFYPIRAVSAAEAAAAAIVLLLATGFFAWRGRRTPAAAVGWAWFVGMLVPVIGLVHVGGQAYADRFTYLPHLGLFVAIVWTIADALPRTLATAAAAVGLVCLAAVSVWQVGHWRDSVTLFTRALAVTEGNFMAHNNLGVVLAEQGRIDEAAAHYASAVAANPTWPEARSNYGNVFAWRGDFAAARVQYEAALQVRPDFAVARNNLATTYAVEGDFARAAEHYRLAVEADPGYADARFALADALERLGRTEEALAEYRRTLAQRPGWEAVLARLTALEARQGKQF